MKVDSILEDYKMPEVSRTVRQWRMNALSDHPLAAMVTVFV